MTRFLSSMRTLMLIASCGSLPACNTAVAADRNLTFDLQLVPTGSDASCRGLAAVSEDCVWVGGSGGTLLVTRDAGESWSHIEVPESEELDFRDVEVLPGGRVVVMSAGPQSLSRVLLSDDNGTTWTVTLQNDHPDGFFNGMDFRSETQGVLVGDPIDGRFTVLRTTDGGQTWAATEGPPAADGEYGFAASGTGIDFTRSGRIALVSGGSRCHCHVFSPDSGTWTTADVGIRSGSQGAGAFSLAIRNNGTGIAIGGDYLAPEQSEANVAITRDGGRSWHLSDAPMPHKACVRAIADSLFIACGRTGIAASRDDGTTWLSLSNESFYTMDAGTGPDAAVDQQQAVIWLAGADGRVGRMTLTWKDDASSQR